MTQGSHRVRERDEHQDGQPRLDLRPLRVVEHDHRRRWRRRGGRGRRRRGRRGAYGRRRRADGRRGARRDRTGRRRSGDARRRRDRRSRDGRGRRRGGRLCGRRGRREPQRRQGHDGSEDDRGGPLHYTATKRWRKTERSDIMRGAFLSCVRWEVSTTVPVGAGPWCEQGQTVAKTGSSAGKSRITRNCRSMRPTGRPSLGETGA
jgi:hypothetical protein